MTADSSRSPPLFSHFLTLSPSLSLPVLYVSSSFHSSLILIVFFFSPFLHLLSLALSSILEPIFPRRVWSFNLVATRGNGKVQFDWRVMMMMMVVMKMMIRTLEKPFAMSPGQWSRVGPTFQSLLQLLLSTEITHTHMETHTHKKKNQHKHVWLCNYRHFFCTHNYIHTGTRVLVLLTPLGIMVWQVDIGLGNMTAKIDHEKIIPYWPISFFITVWSGQIKPGMKFTSNWLGKIEWPLMW